VGSRAFALHLGLAPDADDTVPAEELAEALRRRPVNLDDLELDYVMSDLGCDTDDAVSIREFVARARGTFPFRRYEAVKQLWSIFDPHQMGEVPISTLLEHFHPQGDPRARARRVDARFIAQRLQDTLAAAQSSSGGMSWNDFDDYFRTQSLAFDTDAEFLEMLLEVWPLKQSTQKVTQRQERHTRMFLAGEGPRADARPRAGSLGAGHVGTLRPRSAAPHPTAAAAAPAPFAGRLEAAAAPAPLRTAPAPVAAAGWPDRQKRAVGEARGSAHTPPPAREAVPHVIERVRAALRHRGADHIAGIGRKFRIVDRDNNMWIEKKEFQVMLQQLGVPISSSEVHELWGMFDADGNQRVDYEEFLRAIRGAMNQRRRELVEKLFTRMDSDGSGDIDYYDIVDYYDCSEHPDVVSGKTTPYEVLKSFLSNFDGGIKDGRITRQEFRMYFGNISASIDNDDHFEEILHQAWRPLWEGLQFRDRAKAKLNLGKAVKAAVFKTRLMHSHKGHGRSNSQSAPAGKPTATGVVPGLPAPRASATSGQDVFERLRKELRRLGPRHIFAIGRKHRIIDEEGRRWLGHADFSHLLHQLHFTPPIAAKEEEALWRQFDTQSDGVIDYDVFLGHLCGGMNSRRTKLVDAIFSQLRPGQQDKLDVYDLRNRYDAQREPNVLQGKQESQEALRAFVKSFDVGAYHGQVTRKEFRIHHEALSGTIDTDEDFALLLSQLWKVDLGSLR